MTSDERDDSVKDRRNNQHPFKLVWWEADNKCGTAYGDGFWVDTASSLLHFSGSHGVIIIPTKTLPFIIK